MTAESEVPLTGSERRVGGRDLVVRGGAVMAAGRYLQRSSTIFLFLPLSEVLDLV